MAAWSPHYWMFEVVPVEPGTFQPFVLEVPTSAEDPEGHEKAARRAYWTAFSRIQYLEPEEFRVFVFDGEQRGQLVGPGGLVPGVTGQPGEAWRLADEGLAPELPDEAHWAHEMEEPVEL